MAAKKESESESELEPYSSSGDDSPQRIEITEEEERVPGQMRCLVCQVTIEDITSRNVLECCICDDEADGSSFMHEDCAFWIRGEPYCNMCYWEDVKESIIPKLKAPPCCSCNTPIEYFIGGDAVLCSKCEKLSHDDCVYEEGGSLVCGSCINEKKEEILQQKKKQRSD